MIFRIKIQFTHLGRKLCQFTDRLCDTLRDHPNHQSAESNNPKSHIEIKTVGDCDTLPDTLKRSTNQEIASIPQFSPALHIFHSGKAVTDLLDHIIVIFLENFRLVLLLIKIVYISDQSGLQKILIASNRTDRLSVCCDHDPGKVVLRTVLEHLIRDFRTAVSIGICLNLKVLQLLYRFLQHFCLAADIIMFQE